jgi:ABC-type transport system involved in cytochrome c biogenesis permease subunit
MPDFTQQYDRWHVLMTIIPLVAGLLGVLILWQRPQHVGKMVVLYAAICIGIALSPFWLGPLAGIPDATSRTVLVGTKFAFVIGLAAILAAAGRKRAA